MAEEYWDERRGWRQGGMRQLGNEEMRQQEKLLRHDSVDYQKVRMDGGAIPEERTKYTK